MKPNATNTLYYGHNLAIPRQFFAAVSVDLIYLDPPFNSNRSCDAPFVRAGKKASNGGEQHDLL